MTMKTMMTMLLLIHAAANTGAGAGVGVGVGVDAGAALDRDECAAAQRQRSRMGVRDLSCNPAVNPSFSLGCTAGFYVANRTTMEGGINPHARILACPPGYFCKEGYMCKTRCRVGAYCPQAVPDNQTYSASSAVVCRVGIPQVWKQTKIEQPAARIPLVPLPSACGGAWREVKYRCVFHAAVHSNSGRSVRSEEYRTG